MNTMDVELYGETPEQKEEREAQERARADLASQLADDWRDLLSTPGGRRVMWSLLTEFGLFTGGGGEYGSGVRDCAISIRHRIRATDIEFWRTMAMENDK